MISNTEINQAVIGMVHLDTLPGSPGFTTNRSAIRDAMQRDAKRVNYHGRGSPWLRRGLCQEASGTTDGEFDSTRARLWRDSRGTGNTRTHRLCHLNRVGLLLP